MTTPACQEAISKEKEQGLADIIACNSAICFIDGKEGRLIYRGYDVLDLARNSTFEEVAYLLWYGRLPGLTEFQAFLDGFTGGMLLPVETTMILRMFPRTASSMEVLRTAVSSLGHWDPDSGNTRLDASLRKAQRLTERIPLIIAAQGQEFNAVTCKIKGTGQRSEPLVSRQKILVRISALPHNEITQVIKRRCLLQIQIQVRRITLDIRGHHADGIRGNGGALAETGGAVKAKSDHIQAVCLRQKSGSGGSIQTLGWMQ